MKYFDTSCLGDIYETTANLRKLIIKLNDFFYEKEN